MMKKSADRIEKKLSDKELRKKLYSEIIPVDFSVADILLLHVASTMTDGRDRFGKILRTRISPIALKLLNERKELME